MKQPISDNKNSRGRPASTGTGTLLGQRWHEPELKKIDTWAKTEKVSRAEAIRRLVEIGLKARK